MGLHTAFTPTNLCGNVDDDVHSFTAAITSAASEQIPQTGGPSSRPPASWWNNAIKDAIREKRRKALNRYKEAPIKHKRIALKRLRADVPRTILAVKLSSWKIYVSTITNYPVNVLLRKYEVEHDLDFEMKGTGSITCFSR